MIGTGSGRVSAGLTFLALVALTAACGGSSSGGSGAAGAGRALDKADLVAAANAICVAEAQTGSAVPTPSDINDADQAAAYFDKIDPIIGSATNKLEALTPDDSVAADWNAFIGLRKQEADLIHRIRTKADAKDPSGLDDLRNSAPLARQVDTAATKVGADSCAE
ncbi:MAG TPA: hypothetical protein VHB18_13740 [Mycobacteriales bacterium]|nr:hypothetical protein [Mycobacteriales bacterium]